MNFVDANSCLSEHEMLDLLALAVGEPTSEKLAQIVVAYSSDPADRLFAFLDRDSVVAVIGAHIGAAGSATILHLAVRSDYWRRGLGRRLIESLRDHLGLWELLAETDRGAVAFYERCGFERVHWVSAIRGSNGSCVGGAPAADGEPVTFPPRGSSPFEYLVSKLGVEEDAARLVREDEGFAGEDLGLLFAKTARAG